MFTMDISFPIAIWGGMISFFSYPNLLLALIYVAYILRGISSSILDKKNNFDDLKKTSKDFLIGSSIIFIGLGLPLTISREFLIKYDVPFSIVSNSILVGFALDLILNNKPNFFKEDSRLASILFGVFSSIQWKPKFTPILGSIIIYLKKVDMLFTGFFYLLAYSIGRIIPFLMISVFLQLYFSSFQFKDIFLEKLYDLSGKFIFVFSFAFFLTRLIVYYIF